MECHPSMLSPSFRLPRHVVPIHYALEFQPDALTSTFVGCAYITMMVQQRTPAPLSHLILHAHLLEMAAPSIRMFIPACSSTFSSEAPPHPSHQGADTASRQRPFAAQHGRYVPCTGICRADASETSLLLFDEPLPVQTRSIFFLLIDCFRGTMSKPPVTAGLYHSCPADARVLSTHLEPTAARRLFPCFDEPAIRATFQLSVIAASDLTALSNTEVEADVPLAVLPYAAASSERDAVRGHVRAPGDLADVPTVPPSMWHCVRFATTPRLHTCIIGFHVGRFRFLERRTEHSLVLCRVALPLRETNSSDSTGDDAVYALDLVVRALSFFEDFFNVQLPLKKLDVVGVEAFASLGMENWGMINILTTHLAVTEATPRSRRRRIARLIGHECCHQWFGNLASIEWWHCLWLKEGMCRYLEYVFVNSMFPEWGIWSEFESSIMYAALGDDADPGNTHAVEGCDPAPRQIFNSFDIISYGKGACVLRMMGTIIGMEWLRRATHRLMRQFAGASFNTADLGHCIMATMMAPADGDDKPGELDSHRVAIEYCLRMVHTVSYPLLFIRRTADEQYTISQHVIPKVQLGLLAQCLQQQRGGAEASSFDLFSNTADIAFEWSPETTLTPVAEPYHVPLRTVRWAADGTANVELCFLREAVQCFVFGDGPPPPLLPKGGSRHTDSSTASGDTLMRGGGEELAAVDASTGPHAQITRPPRLPTTPAEKTVVRYFDFGGAGYFEFDYDVATWRHLFTRVALLSSDDLMRITMHFVTSAKTQVGREPNEVGDRCTLLFEWLLCLTNTPGTMNDFLWGVVTDELALLVQRVHSYPCVSLVKKFVCGLYAPLHSRAAFSVCSPQERQSSPVGSPVSSEVALRILELLCLCGDPLLAEEMAQTAQWAYAALLAEGAAPPSPPLTAMTVLHVPPERPSTCTASLPSLTTPLNGLHTGDDATVGTSDGASLAGGGDARGTTNPTANTTSGASDLWRPLSRRKSRDFDPANQDDLHVAQVALSYFAGRGCTPYWITAATVVAFFLQLGSEELQRVVGQPPPSICVPLWSRDNWKNYLQLLLPLFFSCKETSAFPFMEKAWRSIPVVHRAVAMMLCRNENFFIHLLSRGLFTRDNPVFKYLLIVGSDVCSSGYLIARLKQVAQSDSSCVTSTRERVDAVCLHSFKDFEFDECLRATTTSNRANQGPAEPVVRSSSSPGDGCVHNTGRAALRSHSPRLASALDSMEAHCLWMQYCSSRYESFLRGRRGRGRR